MRTLLVPFTVELALLMGGLAPVPVLADDDHGFDWLFHWLHEDDDDDHRGGRRERHRFGKRVPDPQASPTYVSECGACHLPYPPPFLPRESWSALISGLNDDFGEDASLEPQVGAELLSYLEAHSRPAGSAETALRITERAAFRHKHRKVAPAALAREAGGSFSNCGACHTGAAQWDFDDERLKRPEHAYRR